MDARRRRAARLRAIVVRTLEIDETIRAMADVTGKAQARELLREMNEHANKISHKVDVAAARRQRTSARGAMMQHQQLSSLRRELREAHRLIEGLHRRFTEAALTNQHTRH